MVKLKNVAAIDMLMYDLIKGLKIRSILIT